MIKDKKYITFIVIAKIGKVCCLFVFSTCFLHIP